MKKVAIIGTVGVPGKYGGFETLADHLVTELSDEYQFYVYCSKHAYPKSERRKTYKGARLIYLPFKANGIQSVMYDIVSIIHALFVANTLLVFGVSGGIMVPFVRLFTGRRIAVNIDGLEWRRPKWGRFAKRFLKFSERLAVRWSHADITDNAELQRYTSLKYKTLSHLIEYGGDHAKAEKVEADDLKKYEFLHLPYAFKVARIEPENNVHMILKAFAQTNEILAIVGNWEYSQYGKDLKRKYLKYNNIHMFDPIYDARELNVLRSNCLVYIHGHSAGGTNPSLVEAMSLELPVFAFDCTFNRVTTEDKAMYFRNADELTKMVNKVSLVELVRVKRAMKQVADNRYTWETIARKYSNLVEAIEKKQRKTRLHSELSKKDMKHLLETGLSHLKNPVKYYDEL